VAQVVGLGPVGESRLLASGGPYGGEGVLLQGAVGAGGEDEVEPGVRGPVREVSGELVGHHVGQRDRAVRGDAGSRGGRRPDRTAHPAAVRGRRRRSPGRGTARASRGIPGGSGRPLRPGRTPPPGSAPPRDRPGGAGARSARQLQAPVLRWPGRPGHPDMLGKNEFVPERDQLVNLDEPTDVFVCPFLKDLLVDRDEILFLPEVVCPVRGAPTHVRWQVDEAARLLHARAVDVLWNGHGAGSDAAAWCIGWRHFQMLRLGWPSPSVTSRHRALAAGSRAWADDGGRPRPVSALPGILGPSENLAGLFLSSARLFAGH
jgi:hypothetical protein